MFNKDLEEVKNRQTEMNNTLEGINSRITETEEQINDLEDRMVEIIAIERNIEKRMKRNEESPIPLNFRQVVRNHRGHSNKVKKKWN